MTTSHMSTTFAQSNDIIKGSADPGDVLQLPFDFRKHADTVYRRAEYSFVIDEIITGGIRILADKHGTGRGMIIFSAFGILLSRYTLQNDFLVGIPVALNHIGPANRQIEEPALFVPVRYEIPENSSFAEVISRLQEEVAASAELLKQDEIKDYLNQVTFIYLTAEAEEAGPPALSPWQLNGGLKNSTSDIILSVVEDQSGTVFTIGYNAGIFLPETIIRMAGHLRMLLLGVCWNDDISVDKLPILTEDESDLILRKWNQTHIDYPENKCMHMMFEQQVQKTPDSIAVVYEGESVTYRELNKRANQLAHYLVKRGAGEDNIVSICLERSVKMLVGLLAISKTGASYLPIDPIYPRGRQESILNDAKPKLLLTETSIHNNELVTDAKILFFDDQDMVKDESDENLALGNSGKPLYILYTSGSTGKPKGVPVKHNSTVNVIRAFARMLRVSEKDIMFTVTTIAFDLAELDIYLALLSGAKLVIGSRETAMSMELLIEKLEESHATLFQATPVTYKMLIKAGWKGKPDLRIISGGDAMNKELGQNLLTRCLEVWNCWGPTETTIYNTAKLVVPEDIPGDGLVNIGRPFDNNTLYIVNKNMVPVPIGVPGEVYIGGAGVSPGYINLPELTSEKFVPNPFGTDPDDILYKSGDLVKYLPNGTLAFVSRIDTQVKIRGFRIELGEIESLLLQYKGIREAVVILRENNSGEKILAAYYTTSNYEINHSVLRDFLRVNLPEYMIPAVIMKIEKIPLTANNKIDRRTMAAMPLPDRDKDEDFVPPSTDMEIKMAGIWKEVLESDSIGVHSGFFESGGNSLLAALLISKVKKEFNTDIPFRTIFKCATISGLLKYIETGTGNPDQQLEDIPHVTTGTQDFLLSSSQSRIWFLEKFNPEMRAYNLPLDFRITGKLDIEALKESLRIMVDRHESLRTIFPDHEGNPVQRILPSVSVNMAVESVEGNSEEVVNQIKRYSLENARYKFDLANGPLFRFFLAIAGKREFYLFINIHHIVSDAISLVIFMDELNKVYTSLINRAPLDLPDVTVTYADFSGWQNQWLNGDDCRRQLDFWKNELTGAPGVLQLPFDRPRQKIITYNGTEYHFSPDQKLLSKIHDLVKKTGTGYSMPLLASFGILLNRYSSQDDFVLGFAVGNRTRPELETLTGVFINTLPMRFILPEKLSYSDLMHDTTRKFLSAYENQELPLERLVDELRMKRSVNINPVFQVLFNYLTVLTKEINLPGAVMKQMDGERIIAQFDLTLTVNDDRGNLEFLFEYNTDLFDEQTIVRMAGHYLTILNAVTDNPGLDIRSVPMLTDGETHQMVAEWNKTETDYPSGKTPAQLFEEQVLRSPDKIAVVSDNEELTFSELNVRSNRLAQAIVNAGAVEGSRIAIFVPRGIGLVVSMLAVSKTGGTYLPLDPVYPKARLAMILDDSSPYLIITTSSARKMLPEQDVKIFEIDDDRNYKGVSEKFISRGRAENSAYILHTSGSTGKPKGVAIRNDSLVNLLFSMKKMLKVTQEDTLVAETTISFDIAEMEIYLPLLTGAKLIVVSAEAAANAELLKNSLEESHATIFQATPVTFKMLLMSGWKGSPDIRLVCGGEGLPKDLAARLFSICKEIWNAYGPTETTIWSLLRKLVPEDFSGDGYAPIGKPLDNTFVYVLNSGMLPVPVGVAGELYIGGTGVSPGYLNLPELNRQRFVVDPFSGHPMAKMYKTGDLVYYLPDGNLVFLNRMDSQVKIRGFRIELGEIESVLSRFAGIKENVVVTRENADGDKILVAYFVSDPSTPFTDDAFREFLRGSLPEYMVPSAFVRMEKLPLTSNNKIDRKALPEPDLASVGSGRNYIAPSTNAESRLASIWSSVLRIERPGIDDDFFEIGGHSMIAVTMILRIEKEFGVRIPLATLFEKSTIRQLAEVVETGITTDQWRCLVPLRNKGSKKPLFLIHGMGLNVLLYTTIINYLDPDQPVYGLQAKGLNGLDEPLRTIEEIAAHYVTEIITVDPDGPYQLAGYSQGGIIAYEMAVQLTRMGKQVSFLGLLDTVAEGSLDNPPSDEKLGKKVHFLLNYIRWNLRYFLKAEHESHLNVIRRRWRGLMKKLRGLDNKIIQEERVSRGERSELPKYLRRVHKVNEMAARKYKVPVYMGKVHLYKAEYQTFYLVDPVFYGWNKFAIGGVTVHEIPGEHSSTFAPPNDQYFAAILQKCLNDEMKITNQN